MEDIKLVVIEPNNPVEQPLEEHLKDSANDDDEVITVKKGFLEHLLNCLANQKFMNEYPPNGDALDMGKDAYLEVHRENQKAIDKAWNQGMFMLQISSAKKSMMEELYNRAVAIWNANVTNINKYIEDENKDTEEEDDKLTNGFKWNQLVWQEIWMWTELATHSDAFIDYENCKILCGQVKKEDFTDICERRGFNDNQVRFLRNTLKEIGIGEELHEFTSKEKS